MEDFPDNLEYCLKVLISDTPGIISLILFLHVIVALVLTRPFGTYRTWVYKVLILSLLPVLSIFLSSYLQTPLGVQRSLSSWQSICILTVFIASVAVAIWLIVVATGVRWFTIAR